MSILDKISESQVDVRNVCQDVDEQKVIWLSNVSAAELFEKYDRKLVWLDFSLDALSEEVLEDVDRVDSLFEKIYRFIDYMPSIDSQTPVFIMEPTIGSVTSMFNMRICGLIGIKMNVMSKYWVLRNLWSIYMAGKKIYGKEYNIAFNHLDVAWYCKMNGKSSLKSTGVGDWFFKNIAEVNSSIAPDSPESLARFVDGCPYDITNKYHSVNYLRNKCLERYHRDISLKSKVMLAR